MPSPALHYFRLFPFRRLSPRYTPVLPRHAPKTRYTLWICWWYFYARADQMKKRAPRHRDMLIRGEVRWCCVAARVPPRRASLRCHNRWHTRSLFSFIFMFSSSSFFSFPAPRHYFTVDILWRSRCGVVRHQQYLILEARRARVMRRHFSWLLRWQFIFSVFSATTPVSFFKIMPACRHFPSQIKKI